MAFSSKVDESLIKLLVTKGTADVVITFHQDNQKVLNRLNEASYSSRGERSSVMKTELERLAAKTQKHLKELLKGRPGVKFDTKWASNQAFVKNADADLIQKIAGIQEVCKIREEEKEISTLQ